MAIEKKTRWAFSNPGKIRERERKKKGGGGEFKEALSTAANLIASRPIRSRRHSGQVIGARIKREPASSDRAAVFGTTSNERSRGRIGRKIQTSIYIYHENESPRSLRQTTAVRDAIEGGGGGGGEKKKQKTVAYGYKTKIWALRQPRCGETNQFSRNRCCHSPAPLLNALASDCCCYYCYYGDATIDKCDDGNKQKDEGWGHTQKTL